MQDKLSRLCLFPQTAEVGTSGHLIIGGCDTVELAATLGTPLYIFDETTLRNKCLEYRQEFSHCYPDTQANYTCKAFINPTLASIFKEEGLGIDIVSDGETGIFSSATFPSERI
jgi:diaminopimelate decarboxylase